MRRWRPVEWAYQVPLLRSAWRSVRWDLPAQLRRLLRPARPPYLWSDFEFTGRLDDAVWFCAVVRP